MRDVIAADIRDVPINWSPSGIRSKIYELQERLKSLPSIADQCTLEHLFTPGLYVRKLFIPKNAIIVGKIHKHDHPFIVAQGAVAVASEFGCGDINAYYMFLSEAGTKRVIIAREASTLVTAHLNPDNITDLDALEDMLIAKDYTELGLEDPASKGLLQ